MDVQTFVDFYLYPLQDNTVTVKSWIVSVTKFEIGEGFVHYRSFIARVDLNRLATAGGCEQDTKCEAASQISFVLVTERMKEGALAGRERGRLRLVIHTRGATESWHGDEPFDAREIIRRAITESRPDTRGWESRRRSPVMEIRVAIPVLAQPGLWHGPRLFVLLRSALTLPLLYAAGVVTRRPAARQPSHKGHD